jgi:hypothetical protein
MTENYLILSLLLIAWCVLHSAMISISVTGYKKNAWNLNFVSILLIWARPLDLSAIFVNVIFTSYLIVGTYLEEKNLPGNLVINIWPTSIGYQC